MQSRWTESPGGHEFGFREEREVTNEELQKRRIHGDAVMKHLIWSNEHDAWWGACRGGIVGKLLDAGRYSPAVAKQICTDLNRNLPEGQHMPRAVAIIAPECVGLLNA